MGAAGDLLSHSIDIALYLNGPIKELSALMHTFAPGRDVDDATLLMARFANGSIGTFEATRYGVGCQNRNTFEVNGSKGMLSFTLDDMNQLDFFDATESGQFARQAQHRRHGAGPSLWEELLEAGPCSGIRASFYCDAWRFS